MILWRAFVAFLRMLGIRLVTSDFKRTAKPRALIDGLIAAGCMERGDHPNIGSHPNNKPALLRRMIYLAYILRHENPEKLAVEAMIPVASAAPIHPLVFPKNHQWGPPWKWQAFINAVMDEATRQCAIHDHDDQFWPRLRA